MTDFSRSNVRTWSVLGSAGTFGLAMLELAENRPELAVVTADLRNFSGLDRFATEHPDKFLNVGIAEQNLVGVASGLASEGMTVFATTYATFAAARAADPIRVNMSYMGLGVKLVGLGAGFSVGLLGATHMSLEDVSILRAMPNMTIVAPADCGEIFKAVDALADHQGPAYLRLGGGVPHSVVNTEDYEFIIGRAIRLRDGGDMTIIGSGCVVAACLEAATLLEEQGLSAAVINMHTIKPLDTEILGEVLAHSRLIVTVEEHNVIGGLGSAVAEYMSRLSSHTSHLILGIVDAFPHAAEYGHLCRVTELDAQGITEAILNQLKL